MPWYNKLAVVIMISIMLTAGMYLVFIRHAMIGWVSIPFVMICVLFGIFKRT